MYLQLRRVLKSISTKKKKKVHHQTENCSVKDCNLCEIIREGKLRNSEGN